jgi:hypothetical protein
VAHENLSFEDAGASPGLADAWTFAAVATAEVVATYEYTDGADRAVETFADGWDGPFVSDFDDVAGATAEYSAAFFVTPKLREDFEVGWVADQAFATELGQSIAAEYGVEDFESFETDWATAQDFIASFDDVASVSAGIETFATGWSTDGYTTSFVSGGAAEYDGDSGEFFEDFEETFVPRLFSVHVGDNDLLFPAGHTLADEDRVRVYSTGRLPAGLNDKAPYWLVYVDANTAQLSSISPADGLEIVDLTDPGFGTHYLARDPTLFWNITEEL